ncbi:unnamed protein product [Angiostrongylus costaricensis]|uniref:Ribosomal RNA-processing protein 4 n=1 Tax=Angiostrongylus costaricensis TaxID=334426 RepID=A0A0R3PGH9_ANGCS|nr:unnamed protein product [Angiostrongylus costaricensis]
MSIIVTGPQNRQRWATVFPREQMMSFTETVHCGQFGHGTVKTVDGLLASVSGMKMQYSQLYVVEAHKSKYVAKVGDVVVGRIVRVKRARWMFSHLPRRFVFRMKRLDEIAMREHLTVGDLVSAEVQQIRTKGKALLHTRNLKYGKLGQGIMVRVCPSLVKPQKAYMHEMLDVGVIIGCNGIVWISAVLCSEFIHLFVHEISFEKRLRMVRLATCIQMLAKNLICIYDVSILSAYTASLCYQVSVILTLLSLKASLFIRSFLLVRRWIRI